MRVNGEKLKLKSQPSSYMELTRKWKDGDRVEIELSMRTTVERLPDGSDWVAILRGPIVLASPKERMIWPGCGPATNGWDTLLMVRKRRWIKRRSWLPARKRCPAQVVPVAARALNFRLTDVVEPSATNGLLLVPFLVCGTSVTRCIGS